MRQPPPTRGAAHARRARLLGSGRSGFCRPSLAFALLWGFTLPAPRPGLLRAPGALPGPSWARCTSPSHRRRAPIRSRRRRTSTSRRCRNLRALAVCVMRPEGLHPVGGTPREGCRSVSTWRASPGFSVLPGVGDVMDGAVELPLVLDDVARLAPPILIPGDKNSGYFAMEASSSCWAWAALTNMSSATAWADSLRFERPRWP